MKKLEEKARTVLTGRVTRIKKPRGNSPVRCTVDGCLNKAAVTCRVKVINRRLRPTNETHPIQFCNTHYEAFDTLKWEWRRTTGGPASPHLELDGVFAQDTVED